MKQRQTLQPQSGGFTCISVFIYCQALLFLNHFQSTLPSTWWKQKKFFFQKTENCDSLESAPFYGEKKDEMKKVSKS